MAQMHEELLETKYSGNVFKRLFAYIKPHTKVVALCLFLVLCVTGLDLLRPILIGDAIDNYIEGYDRPYAEVAQEKAEIRWNGLSLSRTWEEGETDTFRILIYHENRYYLSEALDAEQLKELQELVKDGTDGALTNADQLIIPMQKDFSPLSSVKQSYEARLMSREDLQLLRAGDRQGILRIALFYAAVLIVTLVLNLTQVWLLQRTGQSIIFTIRQEIFTHVHTLPLRFFDTNPVGRIVTRCTNDVESLNQMYTQVLVQLFSNTVLIIGYAVVMLSINVKLALLSFLFLPVIFVITLIFRTLIRKIYRIVRTKISGLNTFLSENISGMKLIQLFAREKEKSEEFEEKTQDLFQSQMKELSTFAFFRPGLSFIANFAYALIIWRSGIGVLAGGITLGTMYIFTNYIRNFFEPIQALAEQFSTLQNALASAEKIFTVLDEKNTIPEPGQPVPLGKVQGRIEFKNVWFAYENDEYVLKDVSFTIEPGQKAAFVGATGAGKSSILNLIGRYYDIQKGQILIDGIDIRKLSLKELRSAIGQVQQDVFAFTGDIRSNIRLLDTEIGEEAVEAAAKAVNADHFIDQLPQRYDEPVTERGSTLSAGQRQLLSFARTLAFDPKILVMDEATANIDTETESLIQDALKTLMEGRTTIMVAHRLSTIQHADVIYVVHKGRIRESGTHQELLAQDGIYKKLYELQQ